MRIAVIALGAGQAWVSRFQSNPDVTAYLDIAKAYLHHDWPNALNSYWSPLYSWLLAAAFSLVKPSPHSTLPILHAVNFAGFIWSLLGWEFLFREFEKWQGPPVRRAAIEFTAYCTFVWFNLHLTGLWENAVDTYVVAIFLCVSALLVRIRRGAAESRDYAALGFLLGLGFLAKSACLVLLPVCLCIVARLLRSATDRRTWICAMTATLTIVPFITALSISKHRIVVSDTGALNYSMLVGGFSVEGYKESVTPLPSTLPHRFLVRGNDPRVLSFEEHVTGTYTVHDDPAWWLRGLPLRMNPTLQWRSLRAGTLLTLLLFLGCPAIIVAVCGSTWRRFSGTVRKLWFLIVPSLALLAGYLIVVVHARYIAGPLGIFGFLAIAIGWRAHFSPWRMRAVFLFAAGVLVFLMPRELASIPYYTLGDLAQRVQVPGAYNVRIADALRARGISAGDRVGFIGDVVDAGWLELVDARVVAVVPVRVFHDERTIARDFSRTYEQPDRFWSSPPDTQTRVLAELRDSGAQWVVADNLPKSVHPGEGWTLVGNQPRWPRVRSEAIYLRRLNDTVRSSR
jgi:hypothetical protein